MPSAYKYRLTLTHEADTYGVDVHNIDADDYELILAIGPIIKGDPGEVTAQSITDALGYTPVAPAALDTKVDKVEGKGLSTNDFTDADATKLAGIQAGAQVNAIEGVQLNGTDLTPDANKKVNVTVPTALSQLSEDTTHRVVTDDEKAAWNAKADKSGTYPDLNAGLANNLKGTPVSGEFTFRQTAGGASFDNGLALLDSVKGKSLVWNQLSKAGNFTSTDTLSAETGRTMSVSNGVCTITITGSPTSTNGITEFNTEASIVSGHKYLTVVYAKVVTQGAALQMSFSLVQASSTGVVTNTLTNDWVRYTSIIVPTANVAAVRPNIRIKDTVTGGVVDIKNMQLIDLTLLFGAGNEPTTVAEFEALYGLDYYAYNAGQIINNKTTAIESRDASNNLISTLQLNLPTITGKKDGEGESVVINPEGMGGKEGWEDYGIIENGYLTKIVRKTPRTVIDLGDLSWTASSSGFRARIDTMKAQQSGAGALLHLVCSKYVGFEGTYANWITTDKAFYLSPRSVSSSYDNCLFILDSAYSDAETFTAAMVGVKATFELATPETYILDTPIWVGYQVESGGTEKRLPDDTASVVNAPFKGSVAYPATVQTSPEIFWAVYGTTTAADIDAAVAAGKVVMCKQSIANKIYVMLQYSPTANVIYFGAAFSTSLAYAALTRSTNSWSYGNPQAELSSNKVTSLSDLITNRTSTTKYPSAKATFDGLGQYGIVSQTQTWSGSGSNPRTYTMSNQVWGLIPQANIDLFVSAGATFNATTGYFELNGLTDISYNEMKEIYAAPHFTTNAGSYSAQCLQRKGRTFIPFKVDAPAGNGLFGAAAAGLICYACSYLECVIFGANNNGVNDSINFNSLNSAFTSCNRLRTIKRLCMSTVIANQSFSSTFNNCYSLEDIELYRLGKDVSFATSSALNLASVVYMVDNAINTSAITITLHATAYARCQADTTEYTYGGQTYTGILAYASAKNITVAAAS